MVDKRKTAKVMRQLAPKTNVASMGSEPLIIPNHSGQHEAGRIDNVKVRDNAIPNKKYIDDGIASIDFWQRVGTTLSPKTAGDDIETTGSLDISKINDETIQDINFWENTADVGDTTDGGKLILHRKAAEGDSSMTIGMDEYNQAKFYSTNAMAYRSLASMWFFASSYLRFTGDIVYFDTSGDFVFRDKDDNYAERVTIDSATGDIETTGIATIGSTSAIRGTATGATNVAFLEFEDSAGTRKGYVGDASSGNSDITLSSDAGGVNIISSSGSTDISSSTGLTRLRNSANQELRLQDTDAATDASVANFMSFYGQTNRAGFFGYEGSGNTNFAILNEVGDLRLGGGQALGSFTPQLTLSDSGGVDAGTYPITTTGNITGSTIEATNHFLSYYTYSDNYYDRSGSYNLAYYSGGWYVNGYQSTFDYGNVDYLASKSGGSIYVSSHLDGGDSYELQNFYQGYITYAWIDYLQGETGDISMGSNMQFNSYDIYGVSNLYARIIYDPDASKVDFGNDVDMTGHAIYMKADSGGIIYFGTSDDVRFYYDGTDMVLQTDYQNASDLVVDCGTNKTIELAETVWDDLRVPVNSVFVPGSKSPTWTAYSAGQLLGFSNQAVEGNEEEVYFTMQLPHTYKEGSDIKIHVHWLVDNGTVGQDCRWGLEYEWVNIDGSFSSTSTAYVDANLDANDRHMVDAIATITGTGKEISSMLICRLFRNSSHANDTLTTDALLMEIDAHFEIDTMGSRQETSK